MLQDLKSQWPLLALSATSLLAYGGLASLDWWNGTLRDASTPQTIAWYLLAFSAYCGLVVWNERRPLSRRWLWGGAVLLRMLLLLTTPSLSDDIYRYLWDGHVANEGVSPYAYAIEAPELDYLDIPQRALANNTWMASPYLPAAQAVFYGTAAVFPLQPVFLQAAMVVFDLGTAWLLGRLLLLAALPAHRLLIYLWNPLVVVEVAHGGHVDAWMVLLAVGAVYLAVQRLVIDQGQAAAGEKPSRSTVGEAAAIHPAKSLMFRWTLSPLLLALATLTKLLPVLLLPVLFWLWSRRQRMLYGLFVIALLLPFGMQAGWGLAGALDGRGLFGALRIYTAQWRFNNGLYTWSANWLAHLGVAHAEAVVKGLSALLLFLLLASVWYLARSIQQPRSALRLMSLPLMGYLLLTPTLHPWYMLILMAFLPFLTPGEGESPVWWLAVAPWLYFSGALVFSYLTYLDPNHYSELEWVRWLEWLPLLVLLGISFTAFVFMVRNQAPPGAQNGRSSISRKEI